MHQTDPMIRGDIILDCKLKVFITVEYGICGDVDEVGDHCTRGGPSVGAELVSVAKVDRVGKQHCPYAPGRHIEENEAVHQEAGHGDCAYYGRE